MTFSLVARKLSPHGRYTGFVLGALLILFRPAVCAADDDDAASTNRDARPIEELFRTDTVYPQEKGETEVEVASLYQNNPHGDTWTVPVSLEYGLTSKWQVEAEWDSYIQHSPRRGPAVSGIGDLELGTQYSFMNIGDSLFHIAPRFSVELPLGDVNTDLSDGFAEYEPAVVLARDIPQWHHTQLFSEVGFSLVQRLKRPADADDAETAAHEFNFGTGFFTVFPHGAFTAEFNWDTDRWNHHGDESDVYLTPGCLWKPVRNVEVGVGIPVGLNVHSDRYDIAAHVTCEF